MTSGIKKNVIKKKKNIHEHKIVYIAHAGGVTFLKFSLACVWKLGWQVVLISLWRLMVSSPFHLSCLGSDQAGRAMVSVCQRRLTFLPHEVQICCTWQAAGSPQFACLVRSDTDKKWLRENWHTEKSTVAANIWWCDFRWIGNESWCWHLYNICTACLTKFGGGGVVSHQGLF